MVEPLVDCVVRNHPALLRFGLSEVGKNLRNEPWSLNSRPEKY